MYERALANDAGRQQLVIILVLLISPPALLARRCLESFLAFLINSFFQVNLKNSRATFCAVSTYYKLLERGEDAFSCTYIR